MNRPPKRYENPRKTLAFVFIASLLMIAADMVFYPLFDFSRPSPPSVASETIPVNSEIADYQLGAKMTADKSRGERYAGETESDLNTGLPQPESIKNNAESIAKIIQKPASFNVGKTMLPPSPPSVPFKRGAQDKVVIIIDDMGMDRARSREAIDLPGPLTLSFLPYAPQLPEITKAAHDRGHELMIYAPMAPMDLRLDPGPLALREGMSRADFDDALDHMFHSFDGYVGMNNHMGSKLTQEVEPMNWVMEALGKRGLLFVDSKTIAASVAERVAAEHGLAYAARDVFLDNENDSSGVEKALREVEEIAHRRGYAIAIGHPRDATIAALREWLPGLKDKGLVLVPVSVIARRGAGITAVSASYGPPAKNSQ